MQPQDPEFEGVLTLLEKRVGHSFSDRSLLARALTHRSWANETDASADDNERFEFLGDAVLELVVSRHLFHRFPRMSEGELSRARAAIVRRETLAAVASALELGDALRLGRGEEATGGRTKKSVLSDTLEAVVGAVYLDAGLDAAADLIRRHMAQPLERSSSELSCPDAKTRLQEWAQDRGHPLPTYAVVAEAAADHARDRDLADGFAIRVTVAGRPLAIGRGKSKKEAATRAAHLALAMLSADEDGPPEDKPGRDSYRKSQAPACSGDDHGRGRSATSGPGKSLRKRAPDET